MLSEYIAITTNKTQGYVRASSSLKVPIYRTEKTMAPYSSTLAWRIPWTEEPGGVPSVGSHRVGHN